MFSVSRLVSVSFQRMLFLQGQEVTYLLKTFFSSLEREVLALCFRSLRLGYFFFFPLPFLPTLSEPRSSPVAASMSRISSASRQSTTGRKTGFNSEVRGKSLQGAVSFTRVPLRLLANGTRTYCKKQLYSKLQVVTLGSLVTLLHTSHCLPLLFYPGQHASFSSFIFKAFQSCAVVSICRMQLS